MAKNTITEIIGLGFTRDMFNKDEDADFEALINAVLADETAILSGRIGSTLYGSSTAPLSTYIKRAERSLVAAELVQRRINTVLGQAVANPEGPDTSALQKQRADYLADAEQWLAKAVTGAQADTGSDIAFGSVITSTFDARSSS